MFRRNLLPVWAGILLVFSMFLMGQQDPYPTIQGAWQGPAVMEGLTGGELGIILIISGPVGPCVGTTVTGTVMGLAILNGQWNESTRHVTGQITLPDSGSPLVFDCILSLNETLLDCDFTSEGRSGEVDAVKVNDSPENPDPSTPLFDYARSYPHPGETGVPLRPTFVLAWSKPMAPMWDINIGELHGGNFTLAGYDVSENRFLMELDPGVYLSPFTPYTLEVHTCGQPDGFRDPFGVYAECPWPEVDFTTGGS